MKCRICECSELDACEEGCSWVERDLCSTCARIILLFALYCDLAGPVAKRGKSHKELLERLGPEVDRFITEGPRDEPLVKLAGGSL